MTGEQAQEPFFRAEPADGAEDRRVTANLLPDRFGRGRLPGLAAAAPLYDLPVVRPFRTRFFYRMVHPRIKRRLRRTGLCGGVRAYEPCGTDRTTFQPVGEMWSPLWGRTLPPCRRARRSVRFFGSENSRPDTRFNPASAPYTYRPGCERPYPHGNRHDRYESGKSCSRNHVTTHESRLYDRSDRFPKRQWVRRPYRLARS